MRILISKMLSDMKKIPREDKKCAVLNSFFNGLYDYHKSSRDFTFTMIFTEFNMEELLANDDFNKIMLNIKELLNKVGALHTIQIGIVWKNDSICKDIIGLFNRYNIKVFKEDIFDITMWHYWHQLKANSQLIFNVVISVLLILSFLK